MKRCLTIIIAALLSVSLLFHTGIAAQSPSVYVDGAPIVFQKNQPLIVNGRTLIPLREMFQVFAFEVAYHDATKTILLRNGGIKVFFRIDNLRFFVDKDGVITHSDLDVAPMLIDARTYVPLRAIAEVMGAAVEWDAVNESVQITLKP